MMWVDRLVDARRDLETALAMRIWNPEVERGCWPRIGLAGVTLLEGDPLGALRIIEKVSSSTHGPPAQPYYAWQGEILRALGRLPEARAELQRVCGSESRRVGSLLTMVFVEQDLGNRKQARQIFARIVRIAPALIIEVGGEAICDPANARLGTLSDVEVREVAERAQKAMRGNRTASCVTYVDSNGVLRAIPPNGRYRITHSQSELAEIRSLIEQL